ncbi:molybdenum cofactor guanylyltransferase [Paraclostridium bifermentans]|uniref:molybdenum cofactor guanylyltransferase n=1 Tax=Paraclostridium bifermentans TaxID=1490 RepID=UPI00359C93DE
MKIKKSVIILSGGKNSRMNYKTKAFLTFNNKRFIDIIIDQLSDYDEIIISCNNDNEYEYLKDKSKLVKDCITNIGPIGGIYSCLKVCKNEHALVVAADMPFLSKETLNFLGSQDFKEDALICKVGNTYEVLSSVYSKSCLDKMKDMIDKGNYKILDLIKNLNVKIVEIECNKEFSNINTLKEYSEIKSQEI